MFTNAEKNQVRRLLAEHIGNPVKRAARERRDHALLRLMGLTEQRMPTEEARAEFAAADAEMSRVMGWPPLPPVV